MPTGADPHSVPSHCLAPCLGTPQTKVRRAAPSSVRLGRDYMQVTNDRFDPVSGCPVRVLTVAGALTNRWVCGARRTNLIQAPTQVGVFSAHAQSLPWLILSDPSGLPTTAAADLALPVLSAFQRLTEPVPHQHRLGIASYVTVTIVGTDVDCLVIR